MSPTPYFIAAAIAALLPVPATVQAQQANPAGSTPSSQARAPAPAPNPQDRLFVTLVGQSGLAEVQLARLAQDKGRNEAVKRFARRMQEEHGQANQQLTAAAARAGLTPPAQPSQAHQAEYDRLARLDGAAFDAAYLRGQLVEHQKAAQVLQWEMNSGHFPPLQQFSAAALPAVLDHLHQVQQLLGDVTGAGVR